MTTPTTVVAARRARRDATRTALCEAAFSVVRDEGLDGLTAEVVAARAGVSRRTFFNYFPSVESALTTSLDDFFASVGEALDARPADEPVLDSVIAVVGHPGDGDLLDRIAVLAAAGEASRQARGLILVHLHEWLDWLEGWLRRRLGPGPTDLEVAVLASGLAAVAEAAWRVWWRTQQTEQDAVPACGAPPRHPDRTRSPSLAKAFTQAIELLRRDGLDSAHLTVGAREPRPAPPAPTVPAPSHHPARGA